MDLVDSIDRGAEFVAVSNPELAPYVLIFDAIVHIFDWLFGSGHAGSCGAFRDLYFQEQRQFEDFMGRAVPTLEQALDLPPDTAIPLFQQFQGVVAGYRGYVDRGFDLYKGSNLLGMTMFAARFNNWIDRRWQPTAMNFINAYWTHREQRLRQDLGQGQFGQGVPTCCADGTVTDLLRRVAALENLMQGRVLPQLDALQGRIGQLENYLASLRLESLYGQIQQLQHALTQETADREQALLALQAQLSQAIGSFGALLQALKDNLQQLRSLLGPLFHVEMTYALGALSNQVEELVVDLDQVGHQTPNYITTWTRTTSGLVVDFKKKAGVLEQGLRSLLDELRGDFGKQLAQLQEQLQGQLGRLSADLADQAETVAALQSQLESTAQELAAKMQHEVAARQEAISRAIAEACQCAHDNLPDWLLALNIHGGQGQEDLVDLSLPQAPSFLTSLQWKK